MELALTLLAVAVLVLGVACALLAASVPWCWVRLFSQERRLRRLEARSKRLDRVLSEFMTTVGLAADSNGQVHRKGAG